MKKSDLVEVIAVHTGASKAKALQAFDALIIAVGAGLVSEGVVELHSLGRFSTKQTKERVGRNPATGEKMDIPARTRVFFKAAKALSDRVNGK